MIRGSWKPIPRQLRKCEAIVVLKVRKNSPDHDLSQTIALSLLFVVCAGRLRQSSFEISAPKEHYRRVLYRRHRDREARNENVPVVFTFYYE